MEKEKDVWSFKTSDLVTIPNIITYVRFVLIIPPSLFVISSSASTRNNCLMGLHYKFCCHITQCCTKTVQKLFTHKRRRCGILTLSAREAAIPRLTTYRSFLFLFFTPFYFVNDRKASRARSPASRGVFLSGKTEKGRYRRFQKLFKDCSKTVHT